MTTANIGSAPGAAAPTTVTAAVPTPRRRAAPSGSWAPYLFLAPYLVLFATFVLAPAIYGIWISFHSWDFLLADKPFVGLNNYLDLFRSGTASREPFWNSIRATGIFMLLSIPLLVVVPLLVALMLNAKFPGRNFFRAAFFAPYVLGVAVVGILWAYLFNPSVGLINYYLGKIGIDAIAWTSSTPWVWVALVGPTLWWTLGFNTVIYLAGLQDISKELYEAARVDGANRIRQFWNVTVPGLRPVIVFVITVTILASANVFGQPFLITAGGPAQETQSAIMLIGQEGLRSFRMGSAAAMSFVVTLFLMALSLVVFFGFRERDSQGNGRRRVAGRAG